MTGIWRNGRYTTWENMILSLSRCRFSWGLASVGKSTTTGSMNLNCSKSVRLARYASLAVDVWGKPVCTSGDHRCLQNTKLVLHSKKLASDDILKRKKYILYFTMQQRFYFYVNHSESQDPNIWEDILFYWYSKENSIQYLRRYMS